MKIVTKISRTILITLLAVISCSSISIAQITEFDIFQVTDNSLNDIYPNDSLPVINNAGYIMWTSSHPRLVPRTVSLKSGLNIFQYEPPLGSSTELQFNIQEENCINESGAMVWAAGANGFNIFMYDGTDIIQITDNSDQNHKPVINERGQICWFSSKGVYLYDGISTTYLGSGHDPHINDLGQVTWVAGYPGEVMFYDGKQIRKISPAGYWADGPRINNNGYVVWVAGPNVPYTRTSNVYLYDGTNVLNLGEGSQYPIINEKNQVAWVSYTNIHPDLYFYDNHITVKLASLLDFSYFGRAFDLNDKGHLAWIENVKYADKYNNLVWGKEIINFYDGIDISTVMEPAISAYTNPAYTSINMNNNDEIVWGSSDGQVVEIYLAKPTISNTPPVFDPISPQSALEGDQLEFTVAATDGDADNIYLTAGDLPLGATFDQATGLFSWVPDNSQSGAYSISIIATDDGTPSMSSEIIVNINIIDVPTHEELINTTITELQVLDLPTQDFNAYMANLKKVEDLINEGNYIVAINQLNAFIKKVEQDMSHNGAITADGAYFIGLANELLELIRNM